MNTCEKVAESNHIEGIDRPPTDAEIVEHERFVGLEKVSISDLQRFVRVYQPNAKLRSQPGLNVRVGSHVPPKGGEHIVAQLQVLWYWMMRNTSRVDLGFLHAFYYQTLNHCAIREAT
jgi:hypothetical protein